MITIISLKLMEIRDKDTDIGKNWNYNLFNLQEQPKETYKAQEKTQFNMKDREIRRRIVEDI